MNRDYNFNNIVLIGMSGAGKTSIGKYISSKLNMKFVDTDDIIISNTGKTIEYIFTIYGEAYFRGLEEKLIYNLKGKEGLVISTGGGVVLSRSNMDILKKDGKIILLDASIDTLAKNIASSSSNRNHRPLLNHKDLYNSIKKIYDDRKELYFSNADYIIHVDNKTFETIGDEIIYILNN
jgi:shikimate kinase